MITAAELSLLQSADPHALLPGINAPAGNPLATSSLKSYTSITTNASAPVYYVPSANEVVVKGAGTVLSGYNFAGAYVDVLANNVTINDCTFSYHAGASIVEQQGYNGMIVENSTFTGGFGSAATTTVVAEDAYATVKNNKFLNAPGHDVQIDAGVISNNDFSGGGYGAGVHADAIQIEDTTAPITISGNFIDWTNNPDALEANNNAIRITTDCGNTSNVTVTNNVLIGGAYTVSAQPTKTVWLVHGAKGTLGATGTMTNVKISGNYVGFGLGAFYPTLGPGVTASGNTIIDYTNPVYSANAWAAYAKGVQTQFLVTSTGGDIGGGGSAGTATLYGAGYHDHLFAGSHETVFVGGAGAQYLCGGSWANIFKYLSIADSPGNGAEDLINSFDPAKDVIDLSAINSNPGGIASASSSFTFIGTSPFTASGDQVRYEYIASSNTTLVEANLAGDMNYGQIGGYPDKGPDLVIRLSGQVNLTAANFALTSAQSAADQRAGAALTMTKTTLSSGAYELAYTNVQGRTYSSFDEIYSKSGMVAQVFNNAGAGASVTVSGSGLTFNSGAGRTSVTGFAIAATPNEAITETGGSETYAFSQGFGNVTINGFSASGASTDTLQLAKSAFSYLNANMTPAQDLAAIISHGASGTSGFTIKDSYGDTLTLAGLTSTTLAANSGAFRFV